jgi:hypothetical protein
LRTVAFTPTGWQSYKDLLAEDKNAAGQVRRRRRKAPHLKLVCLWTGPHNRIRFMTASEAKLDLLADQRAFYRARAPEYDEWWQRRGRYDQGPHDAREWNRQVAQVTRSLDQLEPLGNVLELAGGTGWWSQYLAGRADGVTVVDSSPEALAINRQRVRDGFEVISQTRNSSVGHDQGTVVAGDHVAVETPA